MQHDDELAPPRPAPPRHLAPDPHSDRVQHLAPDQQPGPIAESGPAGWVERLGRRVHPVTWPLGLAAVALLGAALLHFVDPNEPGNYPTCPWLLITGTFCPGCGTMRAVALLTRLDVVGALGMNPLLLLLLPYLALAYLTWLVAALRPPRRPPRPTPTWFVWAILVSFIVFWIARNLPWFSFLAPGTPLLPTW